MLRHVSATHKIEVHKGDDNAQKLCIGAKQKEDKRKGEHVFLAAALGDLVLGNRVCVCRYG